MSIELRDYQGEAVEFLRANIHAGIENQILCMGTGSGKTVVGAYLADECEKKMKRLVFVVDRIALIEQTSETLDRYGIPHGVIQAQHWRWKPWERIQVASVQTLARRKWPDADLIIVDECHGLHKTITDRIGKRDTVVIGLSATPFTRGLGKHYDAVVSVVSTNKLIADKHLVPFRIFAASEPDMTGAKVTAGEWSDSEAAERSMPIVGDCVAEYLKHGEGRKFIAFGATVAHCEELQRQFMAAGVVCDLYTYKTGDDARGAMVKEFRKPDSSIRGLISVAALSKGFDVSDVGCIIMARPLKSSLAEHIQILGRGLRSSPETGKADCLVLDHSGNCVRFWDQMQDFFEHGIAELDDGARRKKEPSQPKDKKVVKCSQCFCVHAAAPRCPACGFEYPAKPSNITHAQGTLKELVVSGNRAALNRNIWPQIVGLANEWGKNDKWALAQYMKLSGAWPTQKFEHTRPVTPTKEVRNKIKSFAVAWHKVRSKQHSERSASI
ncbi:MAG: DEAD/DEAH box helicase [Sulfuritalea sp.]|jgi:superfamily II DNA or RNA helicase|nr:DEAD/DEAH box helicase [Sulfuritalea sp.]